MFFVTEIDDKSSIIMSNEPGNRFIDRSVARWVKQEKKVAGFPSNNFFGVVWFTGGSWYALISRFGCVAEVIKEKRLTDVYRIAYNHWELPNYTNKIKSVVELKHQATWKMIEQRLRQGVLEL